MKLSNSNIFKHLKNSNLHWYKKIILLAILLFGSFFCVWILNIFGLYDYNQNIDFESFYPYSVNQ